MAERPGSTLAARPLHFFIVADCSGSMAADGKMQALNNAIRETLPHLVDVANQNPHAAARALDRARPVRGTSSSQHLSTGWNGKSYDRGYTDLGAAFTCWRRSRRSCNGGASLSRDPPHLRRDADRRLQAGPRTFLDEPMGRERPNGGRHRTDADLRGARTLHRVVQRGCADGQQPGATRSHDPLGVNSCLQTCFEPHTGESDRQPADRRRHLEFGGVDLVTTTSGRWAAATASVRGASHERDGKPNQDAVRVVQVVGKTAGLVAAVCDGHGGNRYVRSDVGARGRGGLRDRRPLLRTSIITECLDRRGVSLRSGGRVDIDENESRSHQRAFTATNEYASAVDEIHTSPTEPLCSGDPGTVVGGVAADRGRRRHRRP